MDQHMVLVREHIEKQENSAEAIQCTRKKTSQAELYLEQMGAIGYVALVSPIQHHVTRVHSLAQSLANM